MEPQTREQLQADVNAAQKASDATKQANPVDPAAVKRCEDALKAANAALAACKA